MVGIRCEKVSDGALPVDPANCEVINTPVGDGAHVLLPFSMPVVLAKCWPEDRVGSAATRCSSALLGPR